MNMKQTPFFTKNRTFKILLLGSTSTLFTACADIDDTDIKSHTLSTTQNIINGTIPGSGDLLADRVVNLGGCSGTLLNPRWVLTAAHCGGNTGPTVGTATTRTGASVGSYYFIRHPLANAPDSGMAHHGYDAALIALDADLGAPKTTTTIASTTPALHSYVTAYGYGDNTHAGTGAGTLRFAHLETISNTATSA